jgi:hypothetical protein
MPSHRTTEARQVDDPDGLPKMIRKDEPRAVYITIRRTIRVPTGRWIMANDWPEPPGIDPESTRI